MPIDYELTIDYPIMRRCVKACHDQMIKDGFKAGRFKFESVVEKRAKKMYQKLTEQP